MVFVGIHILQITAQYANHYIYLKWLKPSLPGVYHFHHLRRGTARLWRVIHSIKLLLGVILSVQIMWKYVLQQDKKGVFSATKSVLWEAGWSRWFGIIYE